MARVYEKTRVKGALMEGTGGWKNGGEQRRRRWRIIRRATNTWKSVKWWITRRDNREKFVSWVILTSVFEKSRGWSLEGIYADTSPRKAGRMLASLEVENISTQTGPSISLWVMVLFAQLGARF